MDKIIDIKKLSKKYGNNYALKDVDLQIKEGEIHGLIGANGSGKSTLMNILFGNSVISESGGYSGEIFIGGEKRKINNTLASIKSGIGMIHQEFALIGDMNIAENIKITRENLLNSAEKVLGSDLAYVNEHKDHQESKEILNKLGIDIDTYGKVLNLSTNMKQFIEIAREVSKKDLKLLMLDEPSAVLNKEDSNTLLEIIKDIAKKGTSIIFVSHRLEEITQICHRVTVLRDGEVVSRYNKEEFHIEKIAEDMIGHKVVKVYKEKKELKEENIVEFNKFSVHMPGDRIKDIDLTVKKGEILGITSLAGHGKLGLGYGIMGVHKTEGTVNYKEDKLALKNSRKIIQKGIYMISDDRKSLGLLMDHSVRDNIVFAALQNNNKFLKRIPLLNLSILNKKESEEYVEKCIEDFNIKCSSLNQKVRELSGGNQQKVCVARAIALEPELLFVAEPTRGVDVGAKERILDMLLKINDENSTTVVIASSELEELKRVCDRIVVMYEGKIFDILDPKRSEKVFALALSGERSYKNEKI